ncbi:MAG: hypothetical protein RIS47_1467 [Bacteroidota bacterium]
MLRIALFIDGTFFSKVNTYYRYYHERNSNINFSGLAEFIREEVATQEGENKKYSQIVESHWFRGRFSTAQLEKKYTEEADRLKQFTNERKVDDLFMYQGIVQHVYPIQLNPKTGFVSEKGIDVWLSLEAYELAVRKGFDVMVLIAGDTDYVPLIRKVNGLGTRVMVLGWDFEYESSGLGGKQFKNVTRTSQALMEECSYPILMNERIDDRKNKYSSVINGVFA